MARNSNNNRRNNNNNKNLYGRDGRTICGPLRVPKSTCVSLKFARWRDVTLANDNGTDGQTDRQSATQYAAPPREEGRIIIDNRYT